MLSKMIVAICKILTIAYVFPGRKQI